MDSQGAIAFVALVEGANGCKYDLRSGSIGDSLGGQVGKILDEEPFQQVAVLAASLEVSEGLIDDRLRLRDPENNWLDWYVRPHLSDDVSKDRRFACSGQRREGLIERHEPVTALGWSVVVAD